MGPILQRALAGARTASKTSTNRGPRTSLSLNVLRVHLKICWNWRRHWDRLGPDPTHPPTGAAPRHVCTAGVYRRPGREDWEELEQQQQAVLKSPEAHS